MHVNPAREMEFECKDLYLLAFSARRRRFPAPCRGIARRRLRADAPATRGRYLGDRSARHFIHHRNDPAENHAAHPEAAAFNLAAIEASPGDPALCGNLDSG